MSTRSHDVGLIQSTKAPRNDRLPCLAQCSLSHTTFVSFLINQKQEMDVSSHFCMTKKLKAGVFQAFLDH